MNRYGIELIDFQGLHTVPIAERGGKVKIADFARPHQNFANFLDSLPHLLAADSLRSVVAAMRNARQNKRAILWGLGGHVIKCGLAPVLIDLMNRGYATAFAMNGSAAIHDYEIAIAGHTSEDVEAVLPDGRFGVAEETGRQMNEALQDGIGFGESVSQCLAAAGGRDRDLPNVSILRAAYEAKIPVTVHVAIGTDTPHTHPAIDAAKLGAATHYDFRLFCTLVTQLNDGGVFLNVGSAVILPEVFLKALSATRNLGHTVANFTTANFDFIQHYRPRANVVQRPHTNAGGAGHAITGHHEIMIPLLAALLIESDR